METYKRKVNHYSIIIIIFFFFVGENHYSIIYIIKFSDFFLATNPKH